MKEHFPVYVVQNYTIGAYEDPPPSVVDTFWKVKNYPVKYVFVYVGAYNFTKIMSPPFRSLPQRNSLDIDHVYKVLKQPPVLDLSGVFVVVFFFVFACQIFLEGSGPPFPLRECLDPRLTLILFEKASLVEYACET